MMFCRGKRLSLPLPLTSRYCTTCSDPSKATSFALGVEDGFHKINLSYPGLQLVRRCPHIFLVQNFFSSTECQRLLHKAAYEPESMKPAGVFTRDGHNRLPVRTSSQCICPQAEVPALIRKIVVLRPVIMPAQTPHSSCDNHATLWRENDWHPKRAIATVAGTRFRSQ